YCLGLITKEVGTDLEVIAKIRHHFAHQVLDVQFTNTEIVAECKKLSKAGMVKDLLDDNAPLHPRDRFNLSVIFVVQQLFAVADRTEHWQRNEEIEHVSPINRQLSDDDLRPLDVGEAR